MTTNYVLDTTNVHHIFLVDDDVAIRESLSKSLEYLGYVVYSFSNANEFLRAPLFVTPAVLITDMLMPGLNGVELQAELIRLGRNLPIIFISGEASVHQSILAMKQGAIEFLIKPFERTHLIQAIVRGIEIDTLAMQVEVKRASLSLKLQRLSPRERATYDLLTKGYANAELMKALTISLPTAKQYKSEVMRKLNLATLAELIELSQCLVKN